MEYTQNALAEVIRQIPSPDKEIMDEIYRQWDKKAKPSGKPWDGWKT